MDHQSKIQYTVNNSQEELDNLDPVIDINKT